MIQRHIKILKEKGIDPNLLRGSFTAVVYADHCYGTAELEYCREKIQQFLKRPSPTHPYAEFYDYSLSEMIDILLLFDQFLTELLEIPEEIRPNG